MPLSAEQQQRLEYLRAKNGTTQTAVPSPEDDTSFQQGIQNPKSAAPAMSVLKSITQPIENAAAWVGQKTDPYTGAPVRALVGEAMGLTPEGTVTQQLKQSWGNLLNKKTPQVLGNVPSGADIVQKGLQSAGIAQPYAQKTAEITGPAVGGALDPLTVAAAIPGSAEYGLAKGVELAPEAAQAITGAGRAAAEAVGDTAAKGLFKLGEAATQGNLNAANSMKATENLTGMQQFAPKLSGAVKAAKADLNSIRSSPAMDTIVPGSGDVLHDLATQMDAMGKKTMNEGYFSPLADRLRQLTGEDPELVQKLKAIIGPNADFPKNDLTVDQLDTLVKKVDDIKHTPQGNDRSIPSNIIPGLAKVRGILTDQMASTPIGQDLLDARSHSADLITASTGGQGSKLRKIVTRAVALGASPLTAGKSLAVLSADPEVYQRVVGAARLPKQAAEAVLSGLDTAYQMGPEQFHNAFMGFAKQYPTLTEAALRTAVLAPGRTDQFQNAPTINIGGQ